MVEQDTKKQLLKQQTCFAALTNDETDVLAGILSEISFPKDTVIVKEGDPVDSVFIIVSGKAEVLKVTYKDSIPETHSLAMLHDGDAIGLNETGFYSLSGIRTATVISRTDLIALRFNVAEFHGFALAYPHVNQVMRSSATKILP